MRYNFPVPDVVRLIAPCVFYFQDVAPPGHLRLSTYGQPLTCSFVISYSSLSHQQWESSFVIWVLSRCSRRVVLSALLHVTSSLSIVVVLMSVRIVGAAPPCMALLRSCVTSHVSDT